MKIRKMNEKAVSEIIGTILLLGMAVAFFSVLSITVLSHPSSPSSPSTSLVSMIDEEYLLIEHRGGKSLHLDTEVIITFNDGTSENIRIGDGNYLDADAKIDGLWSIGEWCIYRDAGLKNQQVSVSVVDMESNSVIMTGLLKGT